MFSDWLLTVGSDAQLKYSKQSLPTALRTFISLSELGEITSAKVAVQGVMKEIMRNGEVVDKEFIYESKGYGYVCFKTAESASEVNNT